MKELLAAGYTSDQIWLMEHARGKTVRTVELEPGKTEHVITLPEASSARMVSVLVPTPPWPFEFADKLRERLHALGYAPDDIRCMDAVVCYRCIGFVDGPTFTLLTPDKDYALVIRLLVPQ